MTKAISKKKSTKSKSKSAAKSKSKSAAKSSDPSKLKPKESVHQLSEVEALRFGKLDAEIRNHYQGIKLSDYEIQSIERDFQERLKVQQAHQNNLKLAIAKVQPTYTKLLETFSKKYEIPVKNIIIDLDTRVIRDSQKGM